MKYLLMCEGTNEKALIDLLTDSNALIISRKDLLNREVFTAHQIYDSPKILTSLNIFNQLVEIWRIGDTLKEEIKIKKEYKNLVQKEKIRKFCTKPELEILLIINKNLLKEYSKVKSKQAPKQFCKNKIKINGKKYDARTETLRQYYIGKGILMLVEDIKKYKQVHRNSKINGEEYLADILK